jgi:hypothetical protein
VIATYALYDNGSNACFLSDRLASDLGASGRKSSINLSTMHGMSKVSTTAVKDLIVCDLNDENAINLPEVFVRDEIPSCSSQIPRPEVIERCPELKHISNILPEFMPDLSIDLLIGSNCPNALRPLKVIPGPDQGPYAMLLMHGWTLNGPVEMKIGENRTVTCSQVKVNESQTCKEEIAPKLIIELLERDFEDCKTNVPGQRGHSIEDLEFLKLMDESMVICNGHYVAPLPFKSKRLVMPNNKPQAVKRALSQKRKMQRDSAYHGHYAAFMSNILDKGYAERVPEHSANDEVWYLPHHGVYHPRKEKLQVVFDCSARYRGIALNDVLMQGPNLTSSLIGVLTRFREYPIAFMGDVESMFYQVEVPSEHYSYLRFLWWPEGNLDLELTEYHMKVHLFGAISSPSVCNYALRRITIDNNLGVDVGTTLLRHFYVDDCLRSTASEDDAIRLIEALCHACMKGGFNLTKLTCDSKRIMECIPEVKRSKQQVVAMDLDQGDHLIDHALGVQWCIDADAFLFVVALKRDSVTRRSILSTVSAVYDPLGFLAPSILPIKRILQDMCKSGLEWDDQISEEHSEQYAKWIDNMSRLGKVCIGRCFQTPELTQVRTVKQLIAFSDASDYGYGAVVYLRISSATQTKVSFLIGKARLAPIRLSTR